MYGYAQDYFLGNNLVCEPKNETARETFNSAIKIMHLNDQMVPKYLNANRELFFRATKEDSTFCDAYFFTGYTSRLMNDFETALAFYYMADSLAVKPSLEFKQNLAVSAIALGGAEIARNKYNEIKQIFPESPEGYYGFALTSVFLEDYEDGLININQALFYYKQNGKKQLDDAHYLKAILLTLNQKYTESVPLFESVAGKYKKEPNFYIHYSLALLKIAESTNDEKMKKKAKKCMIKSRTNQ